jgi:hypothetical protein
MKRTDKEIVSAMEFIKSQHNGELPYKFGTFECAKMMAKYHAKQLELTAVSHQRELLTDYEKFANGDNYIGAKEMIDKQIDDFIEVNCG